VASGAVVEVSAGAEVESGSVANTATGIDNRAQAAIGAQRRTKSRASSVLTLRLGEIAR
jgi:hypothetical protein